jgi:hypothetical protein
MNSQASCTAEPPAKRRAAALEREIIELCSHLNAAEYRFLELVAEFDRNEYWTCWYGVASCAHWLSWQCGFGRKAASERVRVARALEQLPRIREVFSRGELCYSKVREMTRVATPENEEMLVRVALYGTTTQVERLVRGYRRVERLEEAEQAEGRYRRRHVHYRYDEDGSLIIHAKLPPEIGQLVMQAIDAAVEALYQDGMRRRGEGAADTAVAPPSQNSSQTESKVPAGASDASAESFAATAADIETHSKVPAGTADASGPEPEPKRATWTPYRSTPGASAVEELERQSWCESLGVRRADALTLMAEGFLSGKSARSSSSADRYQVVVHIDQALLAIPAQGANVESTASLLRDRLGRNRLPLFDRCELDDGQALAIETARRLACDSALVGLVENEDGEPLNVGRKTRSIPPSLARALKSRDGGCRFPGCGRTRFTHGHHLHHWANGGETKLSNLITLCTFHHRLVHEGGFDVRRTDDGAFVFTRPDGTRVEENGRARAIELGVQSGASSVSLATGKPSPGKPSLFALNRRRGLDLDARAAACRWAGERMDYGLAVGWMFDQRDRARAARPKPVVDQRPGE